MWSRRLEHRASIGRASQLIKADLKQSFAMKRARVDSKADGGWNDTYRPSDDEVFAGELEH